uniref:Uncharacterized protein n=1 Tax=Anguilla anguilla TaxID=7936 RepID=A0A0E9WQ56_ANGAN
MQVRTMWPLLPARPDVLGEVWRNISKPLELFVPLLHFSDISQVSLSPHPTKAMPCCAGGHCHSLELR